MATKLQILQDHCREFEQSLEGCAGQPEAERLRQQACEALGQVCSGEMMMEMLSDHAEELIRQRFGWSFHPA